jgi:glycosyltransferase involved in cell wall biosynthesis
MPGYNEIRLSLLPYKKLSKLISDYKPEAIHIAVEGPLGWAARRYCLNKKLPFTTSFHTHFPDYVAHRVPKFLSKVCRDFAIVAVRSFHKPAKSIFVATQSLEDDLRSWGFKNKMIRLLRGVDTSIFFPKTNSSKNKKPTLIYVGRVSVEKNIEAFLDIKIPYHKIVVGDGPELTRLRKKYPDVEFTGFLSGHDLAEKYRQADCFVFPSKTDTFGIVLIEALACGLPVAGYNVTGPKDILTHPYLGSTHDDLTTAVKNCLSISQADREKRFEFTSQTYSWPAVAKTFLSPHL